MNWRETVARHLFFILVIFVGLPLLYFSIPIIDGWTDNHHPLLNWSVYSMLLAIVVFPLRTVISKFLLKK